MTDEALTQRLVDSLVARAAGYLRNPIRESSVTCATCCTPVEGFERCYPCQQHRQHPGCADLVAPVTYAVSGTQSAYVMRGYKADPSIQEHRQIVSLLAALSLILHADCAAALLGSAITHWAVVPSLSGRVGPHPLREIVSRFAPGAEFSLTAAPAASVRTPRGVIPENFQTFGQLPSDSHVLLLDDTWTRGGHAQSSALALRGAGAEHVSILVVARWLNPSFGGTGAFIRDRLVRDFDPIQCPWTAGACPPLMPSARETSPLF